MNGSEPLVSVVITAWNRVGTVERAIASVHAQTFQDYEIVLVDDASTDDIAGLFEAKRWPRVRFVRNAVNRGIAGAKNAGIDAARGRYIAFLDSDDEWLPEKLALQLEGLRAAGSKVPLSFTAFYIVRESGSRVLRIPRQYNSWLEASLLGEMFALGSTLMAERTVFDRVGPLDETIRRMEDRDWILRYFERFDDIVMVERPQALIHNSGWPRTDVVRTSMANIYAAHAERMKKRGGRYDLMFRSGMDFEIATVEYRNGEYGRALARIGGLIARDPRYCGYLTGRVMRKIFDRDRD